MMTKDFEPITEVGIHQDDFGEGKKCSSRCSIQKDLWKEFTLSPQLFYCVCREVHHGGLGEEGDSVPRLGGQTSSTEEDPG